MYDAKLVAERSGARGVERMAPAFVISGKVLGMDAVEHRSRKSWFGVGAEVAELQELRVRLDFVRDDVPRERTGTGRLEGEPQSLLAGAQRDLGLRAFDGR